MQREQADSGLSENSEVKTVCVWIVHISIITHYAHGQTFPADVLSRLLCSWKSLVHRTPQYQRTFQPVCQSLVGQIQDDLAAQTDTARADTTKQWMQQTPFVQLHHTNEMSTSVKQSFNGQDKATLCPILQLWQIITVTRLKLLWQP